MKTYTIVPVALLSLLAVSLVAAAEPGGAQRAYGGPGVGMPFAGRMLDRMAERLELDDTQRQTIENVVSAAKPEFDALRDSFRANRETLAALDPADPEYSVDLEAAARENGRLAAEATLLHSRVRAEIDAVLTEEQRAEFERSKARFADAVDNPTGHRKGRR